MFPGSPEFLGDLCICWLRHFVRPCLGSTYHYCSWLNHVSSQCFMARTMICTNSCGWVTNHLQFLACRLLLCSELNSRASVRMQSSNSATPQLPFCQEKMSLYGSSALDKVKSRSSVWKGSGCLNGFAP